MLDEGGPADTIKFVIRSLKLGTPVLYGYDWGGCIAMKMGIQNSKGFSKIIALHPSYNETEKDELKKLKTPTMLQWVKQDQLHPWGQGQKHARKIPACTVEVIDIKPYKPQAAYSAYSGSDDRFLPATCKFLTGTDPREQVKEVFAAKREQITSTKGKATTSINTLMLAEDLTPEEIEAMTKRPDA